MKSRLSIFLLAMLASLATVSLPAVAADGGSDAPSATTPATSLPTPATPALEACPAERAGAAQLSAVSQTDCCKGHKGVCGCRAGKIVCCDNTASPDCTCHSDWNLAN